MAECHNPRMISHSYCKWLQSCMVFNTVSIQSSHKWSSITFQGYCVSPYFLRVVNTSYHSSTQLAGDYTDITD